MILDLVLIGAAIALDPLPLTAFLVVLPSKAGRAKWRSVRVRVAGVPGHGGHAHDSGHRH